MTAPKRKPKQRKRAEPEDWIWSAHRHRIRVSRYCGAPRCTVCNHHPDLVECLCGWVQPGHRRHRSPWLIFYEWPEEVRRVKRRR